MLTENHSYSLFQFLRELQRYLGGKQIPPENARKSKNWKSRNDTLPNEQFNNHSKKQQLKTDAFSKGYSNSSRWRVEKHKQRLRGEREKERKRVMRRVTKWSWWDIHLLRGFVGLNQQLVDVIEKGGICNQQWELSSAATGARTNFDYWILTATVRPAARLYWRVNSVFWMGSHSHVGNGKTEATFRAVIDFIFYFEETAEEIMSKSTAWDIKLIQN